ncbi:flagellar biosynthesis protein FliR [Thauera humireducens]|jgi:flagellar biosynthetic protein FliR|uniref:Flagellar biosynthetic protein FliR n=2 Tax=Thauera TaxID=33057 RepID=A0A235EWJ1_9RHOO|nr:MULTISPECIES: flagellar biosynthetic protein FliR [Thauera]AMO35679.1 flagellar biosynthetic protein FliR [Thauera humireducens]ENO75588.1 flagellar biosynthetic protein FliR [Thauera sp. 63]OYD53374.1 flagellar biosynthetic protein FliR [Thauera propionica]CAH1745257.1 flagellar biosynthesis protein FliR [Thauera humireducens]
MLSVTAAQLDAWLAALMFPLARILGLFASAPIFSNRGVPARVRLAIGLGVAIALLPVMPPMPDVPPSSGVGLAIFGQQIFIGIAVGFMIRIVFAAVDMAGALIGMQMGLSFAIFFDPDAGGQTAVLSDFLNLIATLLFLAINGHLLMIEVLVRSFEWLPVGTDIVRAEGWGYIARAGLTVFAAGLLLSLPVIGVLLVANIALGVLTRAAPQLNLFAVGFPVTLTAGFIGVLLIMTNFAPVLQTLFERGFDEIGRMLEALAPLPRR